MLACQLQKCPCFRGRHVVQCCSANDGPCRQQQQTPDHNSTRVKHAKALLSSVLPPLLSLAVAGQLHASEGAPELLSSQLAAGYVPSPVEVGWEIYAGAVAGTIPFVIATYEFSKRILIQRRCPTCRGSGLVQKGRYLRKCSECGGMLPWMGWKMFFFSSPGNGGPLMQPRGQTSIFYKVPPPLAPDVPATGAVAKEEGQLRDPSAAAAAAAGGGGEGGSEPAGGAQGGR